MSATGGGVFARSVARAVTVCGKGWVTCRPARTASPVKATRARPDPRTVAPTLIRQSIYRLQHSVPEALADRSRSHAWVLSRYACRSPGAGSPRTERLGAGPRIPRTVRAALLATGSSTRERREADGRSGARQGVWGVTRGGRQSARQTYRAGHGDSKRSGLRVAQARGTRAATQGGRTGSGARVDGDEDAARTKAGRARSGEGLRADERSRTSRLRSGATRMSTALNAVAGASPAGPISRGPPTITSRQRREVTRDA